MPANYMPTAADYIRFLPEIIMIVVGTLIMVVEPCSARTENRVQQLSFVGVSSRRLAAAIDANTIPGPVFSNMLIVDGFATFFRVLVIGVGILACFQLHRYLRRETCRAGEYLCADCCSP